MPPLHTLRSPLALALFAAIAAGPAHAQRPSSPGDSVGGRDSSAVVLAPVEVHASIAPTAGMLVGSGVPARVSLVPGRQLDAWHPRTLPDALATRAGVSAYDDLGSPSKLNLGMRGFTAGPTVGLPPGVTVFLDGVRQNEAAAQEVNFDLLPLDQLAGVELLAGSASLLGPNSLGGAINLVTVRGEGPLSGELELSGGSFGQASAEVRASGGTTNGTDYLAAATWERERGWRHATGAAHHDLLVNLGRTKPTGGIRLQLRAARSRAETAGSLPERLFRTAPRTNFTAGDFEDLDVQQVAVSGHTTVSAGRGNFTTYLRRSSAERFNVNQAPDPDVRSHTFNLTVGGSADWRAVMPSGPGALAFRFGADGAINRVRVRIHAEPGGRARGAGGDAGTLTTDVKSPSVDVAGYALVDYQVGRVTLSGGGRYDVVRVPFRNQVRTADNTTNVFHNVSPRAGVSIATAPGAMVYASAGRSFRAPAILELGCADAEAACPLPFALGDDPPLDPVRATTYEVGMRWSPPRAPGTLTFAGSMYRTEVRDEIFFAASGEAVLAGYFTNIDRTRREGIELAVEGTLGAGRLAWYANQAWTRATFRSAVTLFSVRGDDEFAGSPLAGDNDVAPGDRLPLVPSHQSNAGVLLRIGRGVTAGVDARHTGPQWLRGDEANVTAPLAAYTIARARLGYARDSWEVAAVVTNLFDVRRASFGTFNADRGAGTLERFLTPVDARAMKVTLRRTLGVAPRDED